MAERREKEESKVETTKRNSRHLRGSIAKTLASGSPCFSEDDVHLLKFHGTYQQDDRDQRRQLRAQGIGKAYQFMVRCAVPGGRLGARQYLTLDGLADRYGNGSLRITSRQGIQLHGVAKQDLKAAKAATNRALVTTLGASGDVERNVMTCPAPLGDEARVLLRQLCGRIATQLRPATRAYAEIWLDQEETPPTPQEEPFYGDRYLPRKFKTGLALESDNCIDVHSLDCGLIAIVEGGKVRGFNVLVGGGMGMTHGRPDTFAALAKPLGFIPAEHALETVQAVAATFRDHGNRADRRHARLKYLLADWGMDRFAEEFHRRVTFNVAPWSTLPPLPFHDHLGRHRQGNGRWFYGVFLENGRIQDTADRRLRTALRSVVTEHQPGVRLTAQQNLLLTGLDEAAIDGIEQTLADHGVAPATQVPAVRRYAMACPALPTCGLALAESERLMPSVLDRLEAELGSLGLARVPITVRMTGCPNGCARPYTADVGLVGRRPGFYQVYVGGGLPGDRVADLYCADVPSEDLAAVLGPLLRRWADQRREGESLGDFYQRLITRAEPRVSVSGKEEATIGSVAPEAQP